MHTAPPFKFPHPERELFFWAILVNRQELSKLFWKAGRDQIGGALVASIMLKSLSEVADRDEEFQLASDLKNSSE